MYALTLASENKEIANLFALFFKSNYDLTRADISNYSFSAAKHADVFFSWY